MTNIYLLSPECGGEDFYEVEAFATIEGAKARAEELTAYPGDKTTPLEWESINDATITAVGGDTEFTIQTMELQP